MRLATAVCMQKYGNVSFATVACAKCMRYGGGGGGPYHGGGGGWDPGSGLIYIYIISSFFFEFLQVKTQLEPLFVVQKSGSGTTETCQKMPIASYSHGSLE